MTTRPIILPLANVCGVKILSSSYFLLYMLVLNLSIAYSGAEINYMIYSGVFDVIRAALIIHSSLNINQLNLFH